MIAPLAQAAAAWSAVRGWLATVILRRERKPRRITARELDELPQVVPVEIEDAPAGHVKTNAIIRPPKPGERSPTSLSFVHLKDILDQISDARRQMQRLRRLDREAYRFHRRVGARIIPENDGRFFRFGNLAPGFLDTLPAAGLTLLTRRWINDDDDDEIKFDACYLYFSKLLRSPWFASDAAIADKVAVYRSTIAWARRGKRKAMGYQIHLAVTSDGDVFVLPEKIQKLQALPRGGSIYHDAWQLPPRLVWHWEDRKARISSVEKDAGTFGASLFRCAVNGYMESTAEFQVTVERDGIALAFSVAEGRTPYFFKDRDFVATSGGRRQRIFHAVEAHTRTLASGRVVEVAAHYRGVRKFVWNGENVLVAPPEEALRRFDAPALDVSEFGPDDDPTKWVDSVDAADLITADMEKRADERGGYRETDKGVQGNA